MGESRATFHLMIGGAASSGISAKYYRLGNAQNLCQLQSFPASMLTLLVDTVDDSISHPELPTASSWNRIPGDVFGRFYVQWKGFVRIDAAGDYEFQLSNRDGARLTVNNEVLINNWGCFNEMTAATAPRPSTARASWRWKWSSSRTTTTSASSCPGRSRRTTSS